MRIEQLAQQAVLEALLGRKPLPGSAQPLLFPDILDLGEGRPTVLAPAADLELSREAAAAVRTLPTPASEEDLEAGTAVLEFLAPEQFPNRTSVRLRVSVRDEQGRDLPLGEVVATFTAGPDGDLVTTEPTHVLAY